MPKTNWQDPGSSEVRSTHISGLQEAVGKIEDILNMQLQAETGIGLSEVYISEQDRYRIFQAPEGKRNWANSPAPVIKKNGVPIASGFVIDYGGGAVIFSTPLSGTDTVTADFSRVKIEGSIIDGLVEVAHDHDNYDVLALLSEDVDGTLLYNGVPIGATPDAGDIPYDNEESELEATKVQGAIDETVDMVKTHKAEDATQHKILIRDILRMKLRQTGLNLDPNAWSDTLEDNSGINVGASFGYTLDDGKLSQSYGEDLTTGGTAISGGDAVGTVPANVFDDNPSTYWYSSQIGAAITGNAYIGYDFGSGTSKHIRRFSIKQSVSGGITSVKVQKSDNGTNWTDVATKTISKTTDIQVLDLPASSEARYWRLLANDYIDSAQWQVYEVEFFELADVATVVWNAQTSDGVIKNAIVEAVENLGSGAIDYYISRDDGTTFTQIQLDTPTDITTQPSGINVVLKVAITGGAELLAVAWGGEI